MVKCVSILGSTGSIGRQTLDIIDNLGLPVAALTAGSNAERMAEQCRKYLPKLAVMSTQAAAEALKHIMGTIMNSARATAMIFFIVVFSPFIKYFFTMLSDTFGYR